MGLSLDQINEEVDKKYAPFVVEGVPGGDVTLRSVLRMPKAERAQLLSMHTEMSKAKDDNDVDALLAGAEKIVRLVAVGKDGDRLLKELGGDLAKLMMVLEAYMEDTSVGEAQHSGS